MQKSWMWHNQQSNGVNGAIIDLDDGYVRWLEEPGCSCGDSSMEQTLDDFRESGARYLSPPADVMAEMKTFIEQHAIMV